MVVQASGAPKTENHVFNFTSPTDARAEQEAITEALRIAIAAVKARPGHNVTGSLAGDGGGQSAAMAIAQAVSSGAKAAESWYDDQRLKSDVSLQQSLLRENPELRQLFEESLREKPESIGNAQFSLQFWSARLHLLRAHAIEKSQNQGAYNVLSELRPKVVEGTTKLNLTKEQIQLIFNQHPLVRRVYNEAVPQLSEKEFWGRFFVSRLFKKLKGERIMDTDATDKVLDKYLNADDHLVRQTQVFESYIPHFIDLEGNEQNHSQRRGNGPDLLMRPITSDNYRALNRMSEQIMAHVAPIDGTLHAPIGMGEEAFNELRLRDLQADTEEDRLVLNIKNQGRSVREDQLSPEALLYAKQDPRKVLRYLRQDISFTNLHGEYSTGGGFDLSASIGVDKSSSDSDSDPRSDAAPFKSKPKKSQKTLRVGSHAALSAASAQILSLITQQRSRLSPSSDNSNTNLSPNILQSLLLTHNTTTEFLHYFWTLLLSPTPTTERDLPSLLTTLTKSLARISAVAADAEAERQAQVDELRRQVAEHQQRTGKRRKMDESMVTLGGRREVESLMGPTIGAIEVARERYEAALSVRGLGAVAER